jgi:HSP20 family molecular chaperone IbpA
VGTLTPYLYYCEIKLSLNMPTEMTSPGRLKDHKFGTMFRFLDEIDRHFSHSHRFLHSYIPRFDLEELEESYILMGELPGALKEDLIINTIDDHTLEISGRTTQRPIDIDARLQGQHLAEKETEDSKGLKAVKSIPDDLNSESVLHESTSITKSDTAKRTPKRLLSERLTGDFHRSFNFPKPNKSEGVVAAMENGILKVVVPKGPIREERKVPVAWMNIAYAGW